MAIFKKKSNLSIKTRILNLCRLFFKIRPMENFLVKKTIGKHPDSGFWSKLSPPNYLYAPETFRSAVRNGVKYDLDINKYIDHSLYFGFYDYSLDKLLNLAEGKKVVIDVGANIGLTAVNIAKILPDAKIYGFEPDKDNISRAEYLLKINHVENCRLINSGLGNERKDAKLFKVQSDNPGMNRILKESEEITDVTFSEITVVTLDDFAKENKIENIDLIKIDVEGYELKVLEGASEIIRDSSPDLFIELDDNNLKEQNDSAVKLISFLESFGYEISRADTDEKLISKNVYDNCHFDIVCKRKVA